MISLASWSAAVLRRFARTREHAHGIDWDADLKAEQYRRTPRRGRYSKNLTIPANLNPENIYILWLCKDRGGFHRRGMLS